MNVSDSGSTPAVPIAREAARMESRSSSLKFESGSVARRSCSSSEGGPLSQAMPETFEYSYSRLAKWLEVTTLGSASFAWASQSASSRPSRPLTSRPSRRPST